MFKKNSRFQRTPKRCANTSNGKANDIADAAGGRKTRSNFENSAARGRRALR